MIEFSDLTCQLFRDADILSDKYEDVLVNVNIVDDERHAKSLANIKAGKEGYQVITLSHIHVNNSWITT